MLLRFPIFILFISLLLLPSAALGLDQEEPSLSEKLQAFVEKTEGKYKNRILLSFTAADARTAPSR